MRSTGSTSSAVSMASTLVPQVHGFSEIFEILESQMNFSMVFQEVV